MGDRLLRETGTIHASASPPRLGKAIGSGRRSKEADRWGVAEQRLALVLAARESRQRGAPRALACLD